MTTPNQDRPTSQDTAKNKLIITNQRQRGRFILRLNDRQVKLWPTCLDLLLELVIARSADDPSGFVNDREVVHPVTVCRLRDALARAIGKRRGRALIETGVGREYRLCPDVEVVLTRDFVDWSHHLDGNRADQLTQCCQVVDGEQRQVA